MKRGFASGTGLLICVGLATGCGAASTVKPQAPSPGSDVSTVSSATSGTDAISPQTSLPSDPDSLAVRIVGQSLAPGVPGPVKQVGDVSMPDGTHLVGSMLIAERAVALVYRTSDRAAVIAVGSTLTRNGSAQPTFLIEGAIDVVLAGSDAVETLGANCIVTDSLETIVIATVAPYKAGTLQAWVVSDKPPHVQPIDSASVTCSTDESE